MLPRTCYDPVATKRMMNNDLLPKLTRWSLPIAKTAPRRLRERCWRCF